MSYRTFFTMLHAAGQPPRVARRVTYEDVADKFAASRVVARMEHKHFGYWEAREEFPKAVLAVDAYHLMRSDVALFSTKADMLWGPYRIATDEPPSDAFLEQWVTQTEGVRPPPPDPRAGDRRPGKPIPTAEARAIRFSGVTGCIETTMQVVHVTPKGATKTNKAKG